MELTLEQMKANRKLWVEALRSGKYEQASGHLRTTEGYCCLGVLADIAGAKWRPDGFGAFYAEVDCWGSRSIAPSFVRAFVGLKDECGMFGDDDTLAERNDSGTTFSEIADIIESEPGGLFIESVQP